MKQNYLSFLDSLIGFPPEFSTRILDTGIQEGLFDTDTAIDILRYFIHDTEIRRSCLIHKHYTSMDILRYFYPGYRDQEELFDA